MKNQFRILLFVLIPILACAVSSKVSTNETYRDSTFDASSLETHGLAILPVLAGQGVEGYRRPFGEALDQTAVDRLSYVIQWDQTMDLFNDAAIVNEYNEAIVNYDRTAILDKSLLGYMSGATNTRYFLYVKLAPPSVRSTGSYQTEKVYAFGQIWDAESGDIVWEGSADASVTTGEMVFTNESTMDRALKTADALMEQLLSQ